MLAETEFELEVRVLEQGHSQKTEVFNKAWKVGKAFAEHRVGDRTARQMGDLDG